MDLRPAEQASAVYLTATLDAAIWDRLKEMKDNLERLKKQGAGIID